MSLQVQITPPLGGKQRVAVSGRLDTDTHSELDQQLAPILADAAVQSLVLDFAGLQYISSAGIRSIVRARKALAPRNGRVVLTNLQPQIRKVIDVVKAVPLSEIFSSMAEADAYLTEIQRKVVDGELKAP